MNYVPQSDAHLAVAVFCVYKDMYVCGFGLGIYNRMPFLLLTSYKQWAKSIVIACKIQGCFGMRVVLLLDQLPRVNNMGIPGFEMSLIP